MRKVGQHSGSDEGSGIKKTFRKGPWTPGEDEILQAYIEKHGDGNWNSVQTHSGLSRCGKSCRLRWLNHLRPGLKKGIFTRTEAERVVELHALMGNKWARMASEIPGRTDNEIKNFWNTRLKRFQRLGLPIYPDEVRDQAMNAGAQITDSFDHNQQPLELDNLQIPEFDFKYLQCSSYYQSMIPNVLPNNMLGQNPSLFQPNAYSMASSCNMPMEPETAFPFMDGYTTNEQSVQFCDYPPFMDGYTTNEQSVQFCDYPPFVGSNPEELNVVQDATNTSSSMLFTYEAEKLELPSFQSVNPQEEPDDWGTQQNPMPELASVDTFVQTPLTPLDYSSFCDEIFEPFINGSSEEIWETNELQSSLLNHTQLTNPTDLPIPSAGHNSSYETDDDRVTASDVDFCLREFLH